jgi:hypothetical protein
VGRLQRRYGYGIAMDSYGACCVYSPEKNRSKMGMIPWDDEFSQKFHSWFIFISYICYISYYQMLSD